MGSPRQRQVKQSKASENVESSSSTTGRTKYLESRQKSSKRKYVIVAAVGILTLLYAGALTGICTLGSKYIDNVAVSLNLHTPTYVIIIDAGSTGSRINLFTFHNNVLNGQLVLDDTLFEETKPGLSSFTYSSEDVVNSLNTLLDRAKETIPKSQWSSTPMSLRATAGLRLLPDKKAQGILDQCKRVFASSGFKVNDDSVAIMDGSDEGIYSWFTTNFLLDRFGESDSTVAAFDLGGGSNQVTFSVSLDATDPQSPHAKNIHHVNAFNRNISVFTESFLGMGLMAARKEILTHPDNNGNHRVNIKGVKVVELSAECIDPSVTGATWIYAGKNYIVKGLPGERQASTRFSTCIDIIKKVVNSAIPHDLPSLREHEIYAFSYYFERMEEAGLIDPVKGGTVTVENIHKVAAKVCENPKADEPFMCLDLSFIYVLLHDGFGLDKSSKIFMKKYIDGHQLNWALGAAFNILQSSA